MKKIIKSIMLLFVMICIIYYVKQNYSDEIQKIILKENITTNKEEIVETIYNGMINNEKNVSIIYIGAYEDIKEIIENPIDYVCEIDDQNTSSDYDYLKYNFKSMIVNVKGILYAYTVNYEFDYRETKNQIDVVDKEVGNVLKKLDVSNKTEYEKIKLIHDFIINNASYDSKNVKTTAYNNIIEKSSVCQGYAALAYKMMTEAGISCKIISGIGNNEAHAWNIVKIGKMWYNIDLTWDDPVMIDGTNVIQYDYFLKSEEDFKGHTRNRAYRTKSFIHNYVMAENSYEWEE